MSLPRACVGLVSALAWILAACPAVRSAVHEEEEDDSAKVSEQLREYEEERTAREHPAPECGNETLDTALERVCAPCAPGRRCPCAYSERPTEDCDGQNLGGKTCRSLGFLGGTLRCSADCRFDTSACQSALAASLSDGEGFRASTAEVPQGTWTALAVSRGVLGCAASAGSDLRFRAYDVRDLARLGPEARLPASVAGSGAGSFGRVLLAPREDGFLAAVQQSGGPALSLWAVSGAGKLERVGEPLRAPEPRFLAQGEGGYLLGMEGKAPGYPVEILALGADGAPRGTLRPAIDAHRQGGGNFAAAAWIGAEYLVASGASASLPEGTLWLAFVGPAGDVRKSVPVLVPASDLAVLPSGAGAAQVLFVGHRALWRVEARADRTVGLPAKIAGGEFQRIVAAEIRDAVLYAWVSEGAEIHRVRAPLEGGEVSDELVFAGSEPAPGGGLLVEGRFYAVLAAEGGPVLYHLR